MHQEEELTELVGHVSLGRLSDNDELFAADGRLVDLGTFGPASAFRDEYLTPDWRTWYGGDNMRFYLRTISGGTERSSRRSTQ